MTVVAVVSGGMDSAVMVRQLLHEGKAVHAIGFDYGQRHIKELDYAARTCAQVGVTFEVGDLEPLATCFKGSALTSAEMEVPEGHYEAETMKATVVPNRNMVMLSLAIAKAISIDADAVAYGAHAGDHAIYPDCRPAFAEAMTRAAAYCHSRPIALLRPLMLMRKTDIVILGDRLGINFGDTWSCYKGGPVHCGVCGTCVERREAFDLAGVDDPTEYAMKSRL